ncbi:hypothetical protein B4U80_00599 [Leptotrombidium deliense]|uniref:Uncharacterized protein n=1 Tax=Leptotrombidium deliense TaxID=299467 RepID=A0A443R980_9ACAR|nr:hypothetical protein B4U80_00599 [Leptotrombidium deliense]
MNAMTVVGNHLYQSSVLTTPSFSSSGITTPTPFCSVAGSHLPKGVLPLLGEPPSFSVPTFPHHSTRVGL